MKLLMDHGNKSLFDHFQNQIKFWGIAPSFAFVAELETNGVVGRFNKTLKEQIINGRIYRNIQELRVAVAAFVELYNQHWLMEKLGFRPPTKPETTSATITLRKQHDSYLVSRKPGALQTWQILMEMENLTLLISPLWEMVKIVVEGKITAAVMRWFSFWYIFYCWIGSD